MNFLVLALCVAAASAASITPNSVAVAVAEAFVEPPAAVAEASVQPPAAVAEAVVQPAAVATRVASGSDADAPIVRSESEVSAEGFSYGYETGNGISAEATGTLKKVDDVEFIAIEGGYRYPMDGGINFELSYTADENGYRPKSDFLPVAPPTPDAILRALDYIATHTAKTEESKNFKETETVSRTTSA